MDQLHRAGLGQVNRVGCFPEPVAAEALAEQRLAAKLCGRRLTPGEIGCWQSHRQVYDAVSEEGITAALVLEDDADLDPDGLARIVKAIWPVLCSHEPAIVTLFTHSAVEFNPNLRNPLRAIGGLDASLSAKWLVMLNQAPLSTLAYVINLPACRLAAGSPGLAATPADWPTWSPLVNFFLVRDQCVHHGWDSKPSTQGITDAVSLVGNERPVPSRLTRILEALSLVTLLPYVRYRDFFPNFRVYLQLVARRFRRGNRVQAI